MGRGSAPAREISFVSLVAYGLKVSDSALAMGVTASKTRQGGSQHIVSLSDTSLLLYKNATYFRIFILYPATLLIYKSIPVVFFLMESLGFSIQ